MGFLLAGLSGALMAGQGAINALLGRRIGMGFMLLGVYGGGLAASGVLAAVLAQRPPALGRAGPYIWVTGPVGVAITLLVASAVPRLGMVRATTSIVVAQLLAAGAIDAFGLFGVPREAVGLARLLGVGCLGLGAYLLLRR